MAAPTRVAVQVGAATVRVAVAGPDIEPRLVAAIPRERFTGLGPLLAALVGRPDELVLVHAAGAPAAVVEDGLVAAAGLAGVVRAVAAPVAAAVGTDAVAVLDVGHSGAEATALGPAGATVAVRAGGAALDDRVAAHPVRERLSLLPSVGEVTATAVSPAVDEVLGIAVAALCDVLGGRPGRVLLIGGVARTPALAELVDAAGGAVVAVVAERPESAAVLGALRAPPEPAPPQAAVAERTWLPAAAARPLPVAQRAGVALLVAAAVAGLLGVGRLLPAPGEAVAAPTAGDVVQYGYRLALPDGWEHTGGLPQRRRILLTPATAPAGSDLVAVESSPLGYDAGAEPERAARELRAVYDDGLTGGAALSGYDPAATYAGRAVAAYRQQQPGGVVVEWYVVLEGDAQLSVGCQHTAAGTGTVGTACAAVVASLHRT